MNRIRNYEELRLEKNRLHEHLIVQRNILKHEVDTLKARVEPFLEVISFLGIFKKRENKSSLLKIGAQVGIGLLLNQTVLAKAGWLTKLAVPIILKGVTSGIIDRVKRKNHSLPA